jgi:hypothetical protein
MALGASSARADRYALLVGCASYPALTEGCQLTGPERDVALLRQTLVERYGFAEKNITCLTHSGENVHPTRENIRKAFAAMAGRAKPGDQVVILMAGHGSQQPVPADNDWTKNYEANGMDQVFCPEDVQGLEANRGSGRITNGIVDDEIGQWLQAVLDRGAFVWIIFDACHSATMIRGNGVERMRDIPAEQLLPKEAITAAQKRARTVKAPAVAATRSPNLPRLVAFYACQTSECEPEGQYPNFDAGGEYHGLLTFALVRALSQRRGPITYRELAAEIHAQYVSMGRVCPTPLVEGPSLDHFVLDESSQGRRTPVQLGSEGPRQRRINAGAVQGLTTGSVLAVYPPPGAADADKLLGHVKVTKPRLADSLVDPCAYDKVPLQADLPELARCEVVLLDCGIDRLRFAIDDRDCADRPVAAALLKTWHDEMGSLVRADPRSLVRLMDDVRKADWLLRLDGAAVQLVPGSGWPKGPGRDAPPALATPERTANPYKNAKLALETIARATNFVRLATQSRGALSAEFGQDLKVEAKVLCATPGEEKTPKELQWQPHGQTITGGTRTTLQIENKEKYAVDVTAFYVDSQYGITAIYPRPGGNESNRMEASEHVDVEGEVEVKTLGQEHFVVLAVRSEAQQEAVDLSPLAQPPLEVAVARGIPRVATHSRGKKSPLEDLLSATVDGQGGKRSFNRSMGSYAIHAVSFQVVPAK